MCHRHVKVRSPDGEEPPDDAEQEMETPDRSKDDEFEGVSPAEQMKLRGALRGQAKRGRKKGHLKRKNSIRRARSQTEPEESEEKLELPPSKKPRAKSSGAGPELRDLPLSCLRQHVPAKRGMPKPRPQPPRPRRSASRDARAGMKVRFRMAPSPS